MTDRELLEAAAKAAGIDWVDGHNKAFACAIEQALKDLKPERRTLWSRIKLWFGERDEVIVAALAGAALAPLCILLLEVWKWLRLI